MSAAEPADRTPHPLDLGGDAAVIDIRVGRQSAKEGRRAVSTPYPGDGGGSGPDGRQSPQQMLADHFETTFNQYSLSLTDKKTRAAFTVTLEIMRGMLKAAQVQGIVDEERHGELDAMVEGMLAAPRLLSG
jgi:hypothetical protein